MSVRQHIYTTELVTQPRPKPAPARVDGLYRGVSLPAALQEYRRTRGLAMVTRQSWEVILRRDGKIYSHCRLTDGEIAGEYLPPDSTFLKTVDMAALARKRWEGVPPEERSRILSAAGKAGGRGRKKKETTK